MNQLFKNGETVLLIGDSITDAGRNYDDPNHLGNGYPQKISEIYQNLFGNTKVSFINRGISGNRTGDLLNRYENDIKAINPDYISILIGINDVWRRYDNNDPTSVEAFEANYEELLNRIKRDMPDTKVIIMEPFILHSLPDRVEWHEDLDPKIQIVRKLAKKYADYFVPLDGFLSRLCVEAYEEAELAEDGVHPSELGHGMIAGEFLRTLGIV